MELCQCPWLELHGTTAGSGVSGTKGRCSRALKVMVEWVRKMVSRYAEEVAVQEGVKCETGMQDRGMIFLKDPPGPSVVDNIATCSYASRMERPHAVGPGKRQSGEIVWEYPEWVFLPESVCAGAAASAFTAICHC